MPVPEKYAQTIHHLKREAERFNRMAEDQRNTEANRATYRYIATDYTDAYKTLEGLQ